MSTRMGLWGIGELVGTAKMKPCSDGFMGNNRTPTDPFFYATISFQNMVVGSRYWVAQASNLSNVLVSGTCSISDFDVLNIPAYANPMLMEIRVRKGSVGSKYIPLKVFGNLVSSGVTVYIAQVLDSIVT